MVVMVLSESYCLEDSEGGDGEDRNQVKKLVGRQASGKREGE